MRIIIFAFSLSLLGATFGAPIGSSPGAYLDSGQLAGLIFGCIFGTLFLVGIISLAILYCYRKRNAGVDKYLEGGSRHELDWKNANLRGFRERPDGKEKYAFDNPQFVTAHLEGVTGGGTPTKQQSHAGSSKIHRLSTNEPRTVADRGVTHSTDSLSSACDIVEVPLKSRDFTGLGFDIVGNMREGIFIHDLMSHGPALESKRVHTGDRILSVTISFENMVFEDALTILSYGSPYDIVLELQKARQPRPKRSRQDQLGSLGNGYREASGPTKAGHRQSRFMDSPEGRAAQVHPFDGWRRKRAHSVDNTARKKSSPSKIRGGVTSRSVVIDMRSESTTQQQPHPPAAKQELRGKSTEVFQQTTAVIAPSIASSHLDDYPDSKLTSVVHHATRQESVESFEDPFVEPTGPRPTTQSHTEPSLPYLPPVADISKHGPTQDTVVEMESGPPMPSGKHSAWQSFLESTQNAEASANNHATDVKSECEVRINVGDLEPFSKQWFAAVAPKPHEADVAYYDDQCVPYIQEKYKPITYSRSEDFENSLRAHRPEDGVGGPPKLVVARGTVPPFSEEWLGRQAPKRPNCPAGGLRYEDQTGFYEPRVDPVDYQRHVEARAKYYPSQQHRSPQYSPPRPFSEEWFLAIVPQPGPGGNRPPTEHLEPTSPYNPDHLEDPASPFWYPHVSPKKSKNKLENIRPAGEVLEEIHEAEGVGKFFTSPKSKMSSGPAVELPSPGVLNPTKPPSPPAAFSNAWHLARAPKAPNSSPMEHIDPAQYFDQESLTVQIPSTPKAVGQNKSGKHGIGDLIRPGRRSDAVSPEHKSTKETSSPRESKSSGGFFSSIFSSKHKDKTRSDEPKARTRDHPASSPKSPPPGQENTSAQHDINIPFSNAWLTAVAPKPDAAHALYDSTPRYTLVQSTNDSKPISGTEEHLKHSKHQSKLQELQPHHSEKPQPPSSPIPFTDDWYTSIAPKNVFELSHNDSYIPVDTAARTQEIPIPDVIPVYAKQAGGVELPSHFEPFSNDWLLETAPKYADEICHNDGTLPVQGNIQQWHNAQSPSNYVNAINSIPESVENAASTLVQPFSDEWLVTTAPKHVVLTAYEDATLPHQVSPPPLLGVTYGNDKWDTKAETTKTLVPFSDDWLISTAPVRVHYLDHRDEPDSLQRAASSKWVEAQANRLVAEAIRDSAKSVANRSDRSLETDYTTTSTDGNGCGNSTTTYLTGVFALEAEEAPHPVSLPYTESDHVAVTVYPTTSPVDQAVHHASPPRSPIPFSEEWMMLESGKLPSYDHTTTMFHQEPTMSFNNVRDSVSTEKAFDRLSRTENAEFAARSVEAIDRSVQEVGNVPPREFKSSHVVELNSRPRYNLNLASDLEDDGPEVYLDSLVHTDSSQTYTSIGTDHTMPIRGTSAEHGHRVVSTVVSQVRSYETPKPVHSQPDIVTTSHYSSENVIIAQDTGGDSTYGEWLARVQGVPAEKTCEVYDSHTSLGSTTISLGQQPCEFIPIRDGDSQNASRVVSLEKNPDTVSSSAVIRLRANNGGRRGQDHFSWTATDAPNRRYSEIFGEQSDDKSSSFSKTTNISKEENVRTINSVNVKGNRRSWHQTTLFEQEQQEAMGDEADFQRFPPEVQTFTVRPDKTEPLSSSRPELTLESLVKLRLDRERAFHEQQEHKVQQPQQLQQVEQLEEQLQEARQSSYHNDAEVQLPNREKIPDNIPQASAGPVFSTDGATVTSRMSIEIGAKRAEKSAGLSLPEPSHTILAQPDLRQTTPVEVEVKAKQEPSELADSGDFYKATRAQLRPVANSSNWFKLYDDPDEKGVQKVQQDQDPSLSDHSTTTISSVIESSPFISPVPGRSAQNEPTMTPQSEHQRKTFVEKRDSGYGTMVSPPPMPTSPFSSRNDSSISYRATRAESATAVPVELSDDDQHERLRYFQQQLERQHEELKRLGIDVSGATKAAPK